MDLGGTGKGGVEPGGRPVASHVGRAGEKELGDPMGAVTERGADRSGGQDGT